MYPKRLIYEKYFYNKIYYKTHDKRLIDCALRGIWWGVSKQT